MTTRRDRRYLQEVFAKSVRHAFTLRGEASTRGLIRALSETDLGKRGYCHAAMLKELDRLVRAERKANARYLQH